MARNLKSFRRNNGGAAGREKAEMSANGAELSGERLANIESMMNEYGGKSEGELMDELMRVTAQQKREGSFDADAMRRTASSLMPMLTPEQQRKLNAIMSRLGE